MGFIHLNYESFTCYSANFTLQVLSQQEVPSEFNAEFLTRMIPRLEWPTILEGAKAVSMKYIHFVTRIQNGKWVLNVFCLLQTGYTGNLPLEVPNTFSDDTDFLQKLHHVLLEIDITDGHLECPETGRKFPITNGIPNMLLNEDEV